MTGVFSLLVPKNHEIHHHDPRSGDSVPQDGVQARVIGIREQNATFEAFERLMFESDSVREEDESRLQQEKRERVADMLDGKGYKQVGENVLDLRLQGGNAQCIHSRIQGDRIFLSVLPGRETELREKTNEWNYP